MIGLAGNRIQTFPHPFFKKFNSRGVISTVFLQYPIQKPDEVP